uniref:RNA polymerase sigma factor n=1 Tax=Pedobacter schmidteae TaxID=2201271 RepID=UPI000EAD480C|nr:RNA polymerase sigma-70 factor [Pedobacter schmidteae]
MKHSDFSDDELVTLLKQGDQAAFTEIYTRYSPVLLAHAYRVTRDKELARDLVQELFMDLFQNAANLNINTTLAAYLYTCIRNRVLNAIKHEKVKASYLEQIAAYQKEEVCYSDEAFRTKELTDIIEAEVARMPPEMRKIFNLSRKQYFDRKQIANQLNISENTVRNQLHLALKKLRNKTELLALLIPFL